MRNLAPAVTVVVTTFGRPRLVKEAVASVLEQDMGDFELIVVDDNPPASAARRQTAESLSAAVTDARVRHVLRESQGGGAAARNTGIDLARAPWVAFLDDDDRWDPDKLRLQLQVATIDPDVALVYTGCRAVNEDGAVVRTDVPGHVGREFPALLGSNVIGTTSSVLCRKDVLEEIGGFDVTFPAAQDRDLYLRICMRHKAAAIARPLVTFRLHGGVRITHDRRAKVKAYARMLAKYADLYDEHPRQEALMSRNLGQLRWLTGDGAGARADLQRSLALRPSDVRAIGLWAMTWISAERYLALYGRLVPGRVAGPRAPSEPS